jgi:dCMP deaminase
MKEWSRYYLDIARAVSERASCSRRKVGAVIVVNRAIVSTGYNGTASGTLNCDEGGCDRCAGTCPPGTGYETCLCVHAEQNAISQAAKHGNSTNGGTVYCTLRPCLSCLKSIIQAGINDVVFEEVCHFQGLEESYKKLVAGDPRWPGRSQPRINIRWCPKTEEQVKSGLSRPEYGVKSIPGQIREHGAYSAGNYSC